ncbi:unnamed protein product [Amoebophrya sp. A25]|nr:unnamed protein product [Amoebophrya sp. A25]|eukprot:GSA25T00025223001.1
MSWTRSILPKTAVDSALQLPLVYPFHAGWYRKYENELRLFYVPWEDRRKEFFFRGTPGIIPWNWTQLYDDYANNAKGQKGKNRNYHAASCATSSPSTPDERFAPDEERASHDEDTGPEDVLAVADTTRPEALASASSTSSSTPTRPSRADYKVDTTPRPRGIYFRRFMRDDLTLWEAVKKSVVETGDWEETKEFLEKLDVRKEVDEGENTQEDSDHGAEAYASLGVTGKGQAYGSDSESDELPEGEAYGSLKAVGTLLEKRHGIKHGLQHNAYHADVKNLLGKRVSPDNGVAPRVLLARLARELPRKTDMIPIALDVQLTGWPHEVLDLNPELDLPLFSDRNRPAIVQAQKTLIQNDSGLSEREKRERIEKLEKEDEKLQQRQRLQHVGGVGGTHQHKQKEEEELGIQGRPDSADDNVALIDQLRFKYNFNDNVSTRDVWCLLAGQVLFRAQFRYDSAVDNVHLFRPYEHWIPLRRDLKDFPEKLAFIVKHDDWARLIGERARDRAREIFNLETNYWYLHTLLLKLGRLQGGFMDEEERVLV